MSAAAPLITPEAMAGWWGMAAEAQIGGAREGMTAALWRFEREDTFEVTAEPDRATHIVTMSCSGHVPAQYFGDGRPRWRGTHRSGVVNIVPAGEQPRSIVQNARGLLLQLYLPDKVLQRCRTEMEIAGTCDPVLLVDPALANDSELQRFGRAVVAEMRQPGSASRVLVDSLTLAVAVHLVRRWSNLVGPKEHAKGGLAPARLRRVVEYVEERMADDLALADLASVAELSETHFCRAFKQATGMPPHQYLLKRRIERAREILANRELSLADVALELGFSSQSHFTSHFRRIVGVTPGQFRAEVQK
jgi:AraC family transcriptional regulator